MPKLLEAADLSYANIDTASVSEPNQFDLEAFEIVLPAITYDVLEERDYDKEVIGEITRAQFEADEDVREDAIARFRETEGFVEWEQSFYPMMNVYWPIHLGYRVDAQKVADKIDEFASVCTLIRINTNDDLHDRIGEDYAIVLSGGGMNLADKLAAAYLCAGNVPPYTLLTDLRGVIDADYAERVRPALSQAYEKMSKALEDRAKSLRVQSAAIYPVAEEAAG